LREWLGIGRDVFYDETKCAIVPMAFCYPGTANGGDLAPPSLCADSWRQQVLDALPNLELTLAIGKHAMDWHLGNRQVTTLTETVRQWQQYWPELIPLPHPSPRNNRWLKSNPWFAEQILPVLKQRVQDLLND
jgi:uracil-DNA glycosylase